jgi:hypothetical protein
MAGLVVRALQQIVVTGGDHLGCRPARFGIMNPKSGVRGHGSRAPPGLDVQ